MIDLEENIHSGELEIYSITVLVQAVASDRYNCVAGQSHKDSVTAMWFSCSCIAEITQFYSWILFVSGGISVNIIRESDALLEYDRKLENPRLGCSEIAVADSSNLDCALIFFDLLICF